jgi:hypothetical protein
MSDEQLLSNLSHLRAVEKGGRMQVDHHHLRHELIDSFRKGMDVDVNSSSKQLRRRDPHKTWITEDCLNHKILIMVDWMLPKTLLWDLAVEEMVRLVVAAISQLRLPLAPEAWTLQHRLFNFRPRQVTTEHLQLALLPLRLHLPHTVLLPIKFIQVDYAKLLEDHRACRPTTFQPHRAIRALLLALLSLLKVLEMDLDPLQAQVICPLLRPQADSLPRGRLLIPTCNVVAGSCRILLAF